MVNRSDWITKRTSSGSFPGPATFYNSWRKCNYTLCVLSRSPQVLPKLLLAYHTASNWTLKFATSKLLEIFYLLHVLQHEIERIQYSQTKGDWTNSIVTDIRRMNTLGLWRAIRRMFIIVCALSPIPICVHCQRSSKRIFPTQRVLIVRSKVQ